MRRKNYTSKSRLHRITVNETIAFVALLILVGCAMYWRVADSVFFAFLSGISPIIFNRILRSSDD